MLVHPSVIIDSHALIDSTATYSVVGESVRIGARSTLGPFVRNLSHTDIGSDCQIHAGTVVGDVPQGRTFSGRYFRLTDVHGRVVNEILA